MPVESRDDLVKRLRTTTEQMACICTAPMNLWQDHSSAVLTAATRIEADAKRIAELEQEKRGGFAFWRATAKRFADARNSALSRAITAERALAEETERCARIADHHSFNARMAVRSARGPRHRTKALAHEDAAQEIATAIRSGKPDEKE